MSVILAVLSCLVLSPGDRITGRSFATRSEVIAKNGMVATSIPHATQAGLRILEAGGTAVDAAIAANAVQCVLEPTGCGIGGDLFAIVWDPREKKLAGINASGRSPATLTLEHFQKLGLQRIPAAGPLPVSVPGCVDGWVELSKRFGRLPLSQVLAPAVALAREGAPVTELVAHYWERSVRAFSKFDGFSEQMTLGGRAPKKGEAWRNEHLARVLEAIGKEGRSAFYEGPRARAMADYVQAQDGFLSVEDLAAHRSDWIDPVSIDYRGYRVWELPPPGQGIAALQMLTILEGFDLRAMGFGSAAYVHTFVEAKKLAFEDRARFYADPGFARIPLERLLGDDYADERRALIKEQAGRSYPAGNPSIDEGDTICLETADKDGMMVSWIQSNYRGMGSGMTPPGLGFVLQNRGEMFDLEPGRANSYAPKKRPFHTIIPAFVTKDDAPFMAFGVMGGATQPQGHVQILVNMIDFDMNLQEAGDAPRILHEGSSEPTGERMTDGGEVLLESGFSWEVVRALERKGHRIGWDVGNFGGYQAIRWDAALEMYFGASESRKDGQAAGY